MKLPVAKTIKSVDRAALAVVSGIPIRTLYRWAENNEIPGEPEVQELRFGKIKAAVDKVKREGVAA